MIDNPFAIIERRLNRIESLLLETLKNQRGILKFQKQSIHLSPATMLADAKLSVRAWNVIKCANNLPDKYMDDLTIFDVSLIGRGQIKRQRRVGKVTLSEIEELVKSAGLEF